jgi:hypothetical protein
VETGEGEAVIPAGGGLKLGLGGGWPIRDEWAGREKGRRMGGRGPFLVVGSLNGND